MCPSAELGSPPLRGVCNEFELNERGCLGHSVHEMRTRPRPFGGPTANNSLFRPMRLVVWRRHARRASVRGCAVAFGRNVRNIPELIQYRRCVCVHYISLHMCTCGWNPFHLIFTKFVVRNVAVGQMAVGSYNLSEFSPNCATFFACKDERGAQ